MRILKILRPPIAPKSEKPLRFGILGAARIGPDALINPAKSHPDVVVTAVASRSAEKAAVYAKTNGIPRIFSGQNGYQDLIDDPDIDAVYIALPNTAHFEWSKRAIGSGKHVLVEKPITNTAEEAAYLVDAAARKGVILLEAIHLTFHPALHKMRELVQGDEFGDLVSAEGAFMIPTWLKLLKLDKEDIRFSYSLGGGATMDLGVYPIEAMRFIIGEDPSVISSTFVGHELDPVKIDKAMLATLDLNGRPAKVHVDFSVPGYGPFGVLPRLPSVNLNFEMERGTISLGLFALPHLVAKVKTTDHEGRQISHTANKFETVGEDWWTSYRYQLEAFVNMIKGRPTHYTPAAGDSVTRMRIIEEIYHKVRAFVGHGTQKEVKAKEAGWITIKTK